MKRLIAWMFCLLMAAPLWAQQSPETEISGLSRKEARRTMRGFKLFAEVGAYADSYQEKEGILFDPANSSKWSGTVSAGYQFNNFFFLGAGLGADYYLTIKDWSMPIFAQARVNFLNKKITPFFDFRFGYSAFGNESFFYDFGLGARVAISTKHALYAGATFYFQSSDSDNEFQGKTFTTIGLRVGYEF